MIKNGILRYCLIMREDFRYEVVKKIEEKIWIVLVGTTHPGNIGATARAMKTMGQKNLGLVKPKIFPSAEATARAAGADDILANATIFLDLKEAVANCELVIGTSARPRRTPWPAISLPGLAEKLSQNDYSSIAIVFGRESCGLSNDELGLCHLTLQIPTAPTYTSLNLAAAVQIVCYEIFLMNEKINSGNDQYNKFSLVNQMKMEQLYQHLEKCMSDIGALNKKKPGQLMYRLRRLFNRAQLEESEWRILRGFLSKVDKLKNK